MSAAANGCLIGLLGRSGSGKDDIGRYLVNQHDFLRAAIAEPLYEALSLLVPDPRALDDDRRDEPIVLPCAHPCSGRSLLQDLGDWARSRISPHILLHHAENAMGFAMRRGAGRDFVMTDVRLATEIEWIWERGGYVWRVDGKLQVAEVRPHTTERIDAELQSARVGWRNRHPTKPREGADWVIKNNGTLEQLFEQVDQALAAIGAREIEAP